MGQFRLPLHEYVRFRRTLLLKKLLQPANIYEPVSYTRIEAAAHDKCATRI